MDESAAMRLAIACARSVEGRTAPRPPVGAVVVRDGLVVGKGATSPPYGPHAEVHALLEAGTQAYGADLYVTLEPCCITIHTPPCTRAIIEAGVKRVIVGSLDPNPRVSGRGLAQLREAGIEVIVGVQAEETDEIIHPFGVFITQGRPYVTAKWAMTLDGKIATRTGDARWISGSQARLWVHNLRDRVDAILVGAGTVRADDPLLTVRLKEEQRMFPRAEREGPWRIVLSAAGALPESCQLLQTELAAGTCIIVGAGCPQERLHALKEHGTEVCTVPCDEQGRPDLREVLHLLAQKGIMHVLIEGGNQVLGSAFDQHLVDAVAAFIAPKLSGGATARSPVGGLGIAAMSEAIQLRSIRTRFFEDDVLIEGKICYQ